MNKVIYLVIFLFFSTSCGEETMVVTPSPTKPSFSMDPISVIEGNTTKSIFVNLRLNKSADTDVAVRLQTKDGTAIAPEDYTAIVDQLVTFPSGDVQESIKIDINGDELAESDESFTLEVLNIEGATTTVNEITIGIENDDISTNIIIPGSGYTTPMEYANMDRIWSDEFNGEELNADFWTHEIGNGEWGWGNNELQYYKEDNTFFKEGNLVIQAREEFFNGFEYTSSRMITRGKFDFALGRVDIRAALPEGQGIWPALWMLGANHSAVGWPRCGEIDIMELVGHEASTIHGTVHYANSGGNHIMMGTSESLSSGNRFSQEFHVFSIVWETDSIKWLLDDKQFFSVSRTSLGTSNPYPFNDPFFFIFNVAVGGNWPGSPNASTTFPQNMIVDYIRVFQDK